MKPSNRFSITSTFQRQNIQSSLSSSSRQQNHNPLVQSQHFSLLDDKPISIAERPQAQYQPITDEFSIQELLKLDNFKEKQHQNGIYYGQIVNDLKHGKGVMVYSEGHVCQGYWQNDRKNGYCNEVFDNQDYYDGEFVNGKPQGFGRFQSHTGELYEGQWLNGQKHGTGKWFGAERDFYEGDWRCGKIEGTGTYISSTGDKYIGTFRANMKHGRGIEYFMNGDIYNGEYNNGKPDGQGIYKWDKGTEFKGQFKNGLRLRKGKSDTVSIQNTRREATKLLWQGEGRMNFSQYVLDTSIQNNSMQNPAKNNFMPSLARKPLFLLYNKHDRCVGKTNKLSQFSEIINPENFENDPDFLAIPEQELHCREKFKRNDQLQRTLINTFSRTE